MTGPEFVIYQQCHASLAERLNAPSRTSIGAVGVQTPGNGITDKEAISPSRRASLWLARDSCLGWGHCRGLQSPRA